MGTARPGRPTKSLSIFYYLTQKRKLVYIQNSKLGNIYVHKATSNKECEAKAKLKMRRFHLLPDSISSNVELGGLFAYIGKNASPFGSVR